MSAETTGQNAQGGEDLRARYLPVSRKELRRRREAELVASSPDANAGSAEDIEVAASAASAASPDAAENELSRVVEDAGAVEAADLAEAPSADSAEDEDHSESLADPDATTLIDAAQIAAHLEDTAQSPVALPKPSSQAPVRPEEELADASEADLPGPAESAEAPEVDLATTEEPQEDPHDLDPVEARSTTEHSDEFEEDAESGIWLDDGGHSLAEHNEAEAADITTSGDYGPDVELDDEDIALLTAGDPDDELDEEDFEGYSPTDPAELDEYVDDQSGPIPASRRARRLLKDTESIPAMDPELLAELHHTTEEIAAVDDPDRVDPELLKRQQALAAKAMQANQERLRKQQVEQERAARRLRRERPESQVITTKTVRRTLDIDPEDVEYFTGQIEPVHAQGAHGLDLKKLIDATSRQTDRQSMLQWLVVILAVLLVVAVGVVIFALSR